MPLYDFECPGCGALFNDRLMKADEALTCEKCGRECRRLVGRPTFKVNGHNAENGYAYKPTVLDNPPR